MTVAHEHAASATMQQLLGWLTRALEVPGDAPRLVLATPRGERHAFGAMMAAAAAAWLGSGLERDLGALRATLQRHVPLLVGGAGAATLADLPGVTKVRDLAHWRALLDLHMPSTED